MSSPEPRVFTIPPGAPFLPTLADALTRGRVLDGFGDDPFALSEATIYLPTRRAARALAALERRLILTGLIQRWAETVDRARLKLAPGAPLLVPSSPADAVSFAGDLERLMDGLSTEDIPWDQLAEAVETEYSEYFGLTLDFVRI